MDINSHNVNDLQQCVKLLGELNTAISLLYKLDDAFYTSYIFNGTTYLEKEIEDIQKDCDFDEIAFKLEKIRSLLYGDTIVNWQEVAKEIRKISYQDKISYQQEFQQKLKDTGKTFLQEMERLEIFELKTEIDLFQKYIRLRGVTKSKITNWLEKELNFWNIDDACDID